MMQNGCTLLADVAAEIVVPADGKIGASGYRRTELGAVT